MVDFEKLRNEVRILQLDCQQMYQEIDDSTSESSTVFVNCFELEALLIWGFAKFKTRILVLQWLPQIS